MQLKLVQVLNKVVTMMLLAIKYFVAIIIITASPLKEEGGISQFQKV
jgi:hypothetical protein